LVTFFLSRKRKYQFSGGKAARKDSLQGFGLRPIALWGFSSKIPFCEGGRKYLAERAF